MKTLGRFEEAVLLAALRLGEGAYGVTIIEEIERVTGDQIHQGALSTSLTRLEARGLIRTRLGDATPERGGRAKRLVTVTVSGRRALADAEDSRNGLRRLRAGIPARLLRPA